MTRTLVPWDIRTPRVFDELRQEMDQLMEQFFGTRDGGREHALVFSPRTNVAETDKQYEVTVDLPGMKPEEFNVELKDGDLWITGHRKHVAEEKGKTFHFTECQYGQFRRIIRLDTAVEADKIRADYKDGVLHVVVPKSEAVKPKRIEVKG